MNSKTKWLIIAGLACILAISAYFFFGKNESLLTAMLLIGCLAFAPFGVIFGAFYSDVYFRCKAYRVLLRKDYGVIHLISRDGQNMSALIKNFENDLIETANNLWTINSGKIYVYKGEREEKNIAAIKADFQEGLTQIKNKEKTEYELRKDQVKFISGIPVIFMSYDTAEPLDFFKENTSVPSKPLAKMVQAWVITKEAELLKLQRNIKVAAVVMILAMGFSAYYSYQNHVDMEDAKKRDITLQNDVAAIKEQILGISSAPAPIPVGQTQSVILKNGSR